MMRYLQFQEIVQCAMMINTSSKENRTYGESPHHYSLRIYPGVPFELLRKLSKVIGHCLLIGHMSFHSKYFRMASKLDAQFKEGRLALRDCQPYVGRRDSLLLCSVYVRSSVNQLLD
ncbi:hypothetical protein PENTCL1PPCAC_14458 [Pristionchus entomophagus]|uniref:Uncharacterized protein n=1 Tax=Pristionchus entomophagus TaxID=358040 RepID=A0AAV5TAN3_9BILA|nr:hypothetical protein PENTCL1PPCAC_14458 [Pristionchus entomophagus]